MKKVKALQSNSKTAAQLQTVLLHDLKAFRKGKISYKEAQTVARMSDSIMRTMSV